MRFGHHRLQHIYYLDRIGEGIKTMTILLRSKMKNIRAAWSYSLPKILFTLVLLPIYSSIHPLNKYVLETLSFNYQDCDSIPIFEKSRVRSSRFMVYLTCAIVGLGRMRSYMTCGGSQRRLSYADL